MRKPAILFLFLAVGGAGTFWIWEGPAASPTPLPQARREIPPPGEPGLSSADFARLIGTLSEPEGYFDTDNFITNETSYLHVVDTLEEDVAPGGVYLGVGPDQNFSYIVHTRPDLAFIVDIRRQNMLQHLLLKVLIEGAETRKEYLCTLIARDCTGIPDDSALPDLLDRIGGAPLRPEALTSTLRRVSQTLVLDYGLALDDEDLEGIGYVHRSFAQAGLQMRFSSYGRSGAGYPTYAEILGSRDLDGDLESYLATEERFLWLQAFERENRLVPLVGDFAGDMAMRRLSVWLREEGLEVSLFYTSNVEFYLFGTPAWDAWLTNLRRLPFREGAVFVRSYFPTGWPVHPRNVPPHRATSLVQDVDGFLVDAAGTEQRTYWDVVTRNLR
jgi:hypothetical protein